MSGIDAIRGFDYQISYTLFLIISFMKNEVDKIEKFKFESLTEEEEDFNILYKIGTREYIQIKKKDESNMWSASEIKEAFAHYIKNYSDNTKFRFITNGSANKDVKKLKRCLADEKYCISKKEIEKFRPNDCEFNQFVKILETIRIETLVMTSNNENDISEMVKKETIRLLVSASFFLKDDVLIIYDRLWKYIFDLSKNGEEISFLVLKENFKKYGVECVSSEAWLKFPKMNEFVGRRKEMQLLTQVTQKAKRVSVLGISGIGKSYMVANWAKKMKTENENVCWISLRANMTYSKLINILGSFVETTLGKASFKDELENREIGEQVENISNILENYRIIFVLDSYEKASGNIQFFLSNVFKSIKKSGKSIMIVTTTQRMELYTESDIKLGKVYEYILDGFSYEDIIQFYADCRLTCEEIKEVWEVIGGYPVANSLLMSYIQDNENGFKISELLDLTNEEKNQWIFGSIYKDLPYEEKQVLAYLSSMDYGFSEYEEKIIERVLKNRINYVIRSLINKNLVKYDGSVYYLHDVIRLLIYDQIVDDEKVKIHQIFEEKYSNRLFDFKNKKENLEDSYLSDKWGYHVCQLFRLGELRNLELGEILSLDAELQFDLWGIYCKGFPYEFNDKSLETTEKRISVLESKKLIIRQENKWRLNQDIINLKMLFLLEYVLKRRYSAMSMSLGYIPIFSINYAFYRQELFCEWEHCIEFMLLEQERGVRSCPIFGHNCPEGEEHVIFCKEMIEKAESLPD